MTDMTQTQTHPTHPQPAPARPWPALWALVIGFFMILIDTTIVSVATPTIMGKLNADVNNVVWVTSAYLLAYAVPLLITGRMGDRYGPKNLYLAGLTLFTLASLWCGLSGTGVLTIHDGITTLIIARVVQGLGASLMTPQTMSVITRTFPPERRGTAMALWGSVAGVAILVGPILGGVLVDSLGWEWIFFVNVPIGVIAFVAAFILVPRLETHAHRFDILGVILSGIAMFLLVFGIQEGETYHWGTITGPITVWGLIIAGIVVMAAFVLWQHLNSGEPLLPLRLFTDRNFTLANIGITAMGFAVTCMAFPMMLFAQSARGLTPTHAALLLTPMAVISAGLAPVVGKAMFKVNPKWFTIAGFLLLSVALVVYWSMMTPGHSILWLLVPSAIMGVANAGIWGPMSVTATRNLSPRDAGAGSGVYNTTRQIGSVLGSAAISALIQARLVANMPTGGGTAPRQASFGGGRLPAFLEEGFSRAMGQTLLLPAAVAVIGVVAALFFAKPIVKAAWPRPAAAPVREAAAASTTTVEADQPETPRPTAEPVPADLR